MERQRDLLMKDSAIKCPAEYDQHPVFLVNQATNKVIAKRRTKVYQNLSSFLYFIMLRSTDHHFLIFSSKRKDNKTLNVLFVKVPSGKRNDNCMMKSMLLKRENYEPDRNKL